MQRRMELLQIQREESKESERLIEAPGECREDWKILIEVAQRLGAKGFDYKDPEEIFEEIRITTPSYRGV